MPVSLEEYADYLRHVLKAGALSEGKQCKTCDQRFTCCTYLKHSEAVFESAYAYPGCCKPTVCQIAGCPFRDVCNRYMRSLVKK